MRIRDEEDAMFPTLSLHLHRLASRGQLRFEKADPKRVERLLKFYVRSLPALLDAERCNIFVYDPDARKAWVEVGTGVTEGEFEVPAKSTLIGEVISSGRLTIANDLHARTGTHIEISPAANFVSRNAIYAPVRSRCHDEVIGVIEVLNRKNGADFGAADAVVLEQASECVQDLLDSVFLSQNVFGATATVATVGRWTLRGAFSLVLLGSVLTIVALLGLASLPSLPVVTDAIGPLLAPLRAGPAG
jgi:hypothetical protein